MFKILHKCPLSHIGSRPTKKVAQRWFEQPDGVPARKSMFMRARLHTSKKAQRNQCSAGCDGRKFRPQLHNILRPLSQERETPLLFPFLRFPRSNLYACKTSHLEAEPSSKEVCASERATAGIESRAARQDAPPKIHAAAKESKEDELHNNPTAIVG